MNAREALIALNMIEQVGPVRLRQLLDVLGDPVSILKAPARQLEQVASIGAQTAATIADWENQVDLSGELRRIGEYGCRVLIQEDPEYPRWLKEIYDPPVVLYVKGELTDLNRPFVAVVGSRLTTPYGKETARRLGYQLAYAGVPVVSGGARGVDTAAQKGALAADGRTVTVLGNGINIVFPSENAGLFEQVAASGALVTQFPFNRRADKQTFPIRNRIVAGMSLGTVVVEANRHSGALITANMAADYGRQVFAVPGRVDSPRSKGCHDLIKQGAKLCEGVEDILAEFEPLFPEASAGSGSNEPETSPGAPPAVDALNDVERTVLDQLGREEVGLDEVIERTGLSSASVSVALFKLELKRLARQLPGKRFALRG